MTIYSSDLPSFLIIIGEDGGLHGLEEYCAALMKMIHMVASH